MSDSASASASASSSSSTSTSDFDQKSKPQSLLQQKPTSKPKTRNSERVTHLLKVLKPKHKLKRLLDVGCGNAEITGEVAREYGITEVYGVDVFPENEFKESQTQIPVTYSQVKDNKINLPDQSVDLITCFMSIHHFDDFDCMMKELYRVLKPRGWLFIREHDVPIENKGLKKRLDEMHEQYPDHPGGPINYWSRSQLDKELLTRGFSHFANSDYPKSMNNKQAIYHSLFLKRIFN